MTICILLLVLAAILLSGSKKASLVKIDECVIYDTVRDRIIIKLPFKKSIAIPNELRKTHRVVYLNHKQYQFYDNYILINRQKIYL